MSEDNLSLFGGMSSVDRYSIEQHFTKRTFAAGESICKYGDAADAMFIIQAGRVEIRRPQRREGEFDVIAQLETGQVIGETSLVGKHQRNATAVALDAVTTLVVSRADMDRFKKDNPAVAFALYEALIEQILVRFRSLTDKKDMLKFWLG